MSENPTGRKVLIAEDETCTAFLYRNLLQKEGYEVTHCSDGEAALQALAREKFDAVVLDLMMPTMDGMQVLKSMRCLDEHTFTPVIITTAARLKLVEEEAYRYKARLFLEKTQHQELIDGLKEIMAENATLEATKLRLAPAQPIARQERPTPVSREPLEAAEEPKGFGRFFRRAKTSE
jgi:CheY-like chemotaxis protein